MLYLVAFEKGVESPKAVKPMRGEWRNLDYGTMRKLLEQIYPQHQIFSPLENAAPDSILVSIWSSKSKDGVGRSGGRFYEWAVKKNAG